MEKANFIFSNFYESVTLTTKLTLLCSHYYGNKIYDTL